MVVALIENNSNPLQSRTLVFRGHTAVVTLRHSLIRTRVWFGVNEASLLRHEITPIFIVSPPLSQFSVLRVACFSIIPKLLA